MSLSLRKDSFSLTECEGYGCENGPGVKTYLCLSCGSSYCDTCWDRQGPHRPGKVGLDRMPHEKTNRHIYDRLKTIFEPPEDYQELSRLHIEDEDTTWFGVEKDNSGQPVLKDHGRYQAIMTETKQPRAGIRSPQLVSFVGQTGAGKSTLIKMLVSLKEQDPSSNLPFTFKSPVVGSVKNDNSPTSGDVHLYIDPETAYGPLPLLYADCEGMEGGETPPMATQLRETLKKSGQGPIRQLFSTRPRELAYAKNNNEAKTRTYAVTQLYPRLLYTFSDVVVFVLRNARTFESSALRLLLEWASTSLESSVNQPTLPRAIIVLNASDVSIDDGEWDISATTKKLMDHVAGIINEEPLFTELAEHWRKKGKKIDNMLELIRCYYADISIVRIPTRGRYMLANKQIGKLHKQIWDDCYASSTAKYNAHMLSNTDEFNIYLQAGFDHFSSKENQPFNFIEVALKNNPIPRDFGDHILYVAAQVQKVTHIRDGPELFYKMSSLVASCIAVDCTRQRRPGKAVDLFDQFYLGTCTAALEHFCDKYWPCSYVSPAGVACVNVRSSHGVKGHQDASGRIISAGDYVSQFSAALLVSEWQNMIRGYLQAIESRLEDAAPSRFADSFKGVDNSKLFELHQQNLEIFFGCFKRFNAFDFRSLTSCFSCLTEVPQHPLQCGHTLCTACVRAYGTSNDRSSVSVNYCPLHENSTRDYSPRVVRFKPDFAGVRVLTLDGGGIRGIVEIEVLRAIERALGGNIPVQAFFDLIVGTSTGGIIALGLGVKHWDLDSCADRFSRLCYEAFTPREFEKLYGLNTAAAVAHGSRYKTTPLRQALASTFGENGPLYGRPPKINRSFDTNVAVMASSGSGKGAIVLANYSRQEDDDPEYEFEFPHQLKIWEAASATSAAPTFFKEFAKNGKTYLDGALHHNNPVRVANNERKLLWPDVANAHPDLLLSIGTAMNKHAVDEELAKNPLHEPLKPKPQVEENTPYFRFMQSVERKTRKATQFGRIGRGIRVLYGKVDEILDAERQWRMFRADVKEKLENEDDINRYVRLNVDLGVNPPQLDEKQKLPELREKTRELLDSIKYQAVIEKIAHRLVASTFYFLKDDRIGFSKSSSSYVCTGTILCRFDSKLPDFVKNMRALGEFLRSQQFVNFQPFFSIKDNAEDTDEIKIEISQDTIDSMISRAEFQLNTPIKIKTRSHLSSTTIYLGLRGVDSSQPSLYPISGFPRVLVTEDKMNASRLDRRAELIRKRRYNDLIVANDPKVIHSSERVPQIGHEASSPLPTPYMTDDNVEEMNPLSTATSVATTADPKDISPRSTADSTPHTDPERENSDGSKFSVMSESDISSIPEGFEKP